MQELRLAWQASHKDLCSVCCICCAVHITGTQPCFFVIYITSRWQWDAVLGLLRSPAGDSSGWLLLFPCRLVSCHHIIPCSHPLHLWHQWVSQQTCSRASFKISLHMSSVQLFHSVVRVQL